MIGLGSDKNILHRRCHWLSLYLYLSVYLYLYFRPSLDSWHHQLWENIRFGGYLRPDSSVTAHLWTQEKLLRTGRDGWTGGRGDIEGSTRGPRGPKKWSLSLCPTSHFCTLKTLNQLPSFFQVSTLSYEKHSDYSDSESPPLNLIFGDWKSTPQNAKVCDSILGNWFPGYLEAT